MRTFRHDAILTGIEHMAERIDDPEVLKKAHKVLEREYYQIPGAALLGIRPVDTLRYYARHLSDREIEKVIEYIHTLKGFLF